MGQEGEKLQEEQEMAWEEELRRQTGISLLQWNIYSSIMHLKL
jgi:hypothetical protein